MIEETQLRTLASMVAAGQTVREACKDLAISESTAYRWSKRKEFREAVAEIQEESIRGLLGMLLTSHRAAVGTLLTMAKEAKSEAVRLKAAEAVVTLAMKGYDAVVTRREVEELKAAVAELTAEAGIKGDCE
jgi:hypothetical protein